MVGVCGFLHGFPYFGAIEISDSTDKTYHYLHQHSVLIKLLVLIQNKQQ